MIVIVFTRVSAHYRYLLTVYILSPGMFTAPERVPLSSVRTTAVPIVNTSEDLVFKMSTSSELLAVVDLDHDLDERCCGRHCYGLAHSYVGYMGSWDRLKIMTANIYENNIYLISFNTIVRLDKFQIYLSSSYNQLHHTMIDLVH